MKINIEPGKYVVAVSGGVDSIVLLDLLSKLSDVDLVVAHFNHGIRSDSALDEALVKKAAADYGLPFESGYGQLGINTSEEAARSARYKFLESVKTIYQAKAIITAHHQDDLVETALLNVLRGSGRRGLVAIAVNENIVRPLLHIPKSDILKYAQANNLQWREDSSNQDEKHLRNRLRKNVVPKLSAKQKQKLLDNLEMLANNHRLTEELITELSNQIASDGKIDRQQFIALPGNVGQELVVFWLRQNGAKDFDKKMVERASMAIRTARASTVHQIKNGLVLKVEKDSALFRAP